MTKHFTSSSPAAFETSAAGARNLTAAGLAIVAVTYGLARYCFGLFLPDIRQEFSLGTETIGMIAGLSYMGYLMATFAGSWLSTVFEPRLPILLGGVAATAGMVMIGLASEPWVLALGVFVAGASPGLSYPPFSDVIVRNTAPGRQNAIYAWINSGTGFGVALAGPLALYAGENWRFAWLAFAVIAAAVTIWNISALPRRSAFALRMSTAGSLRILFEPRAAVLFSAALIFGVITAVYWTYAVELLWALTGSSRDSVFFWFVLGLAGVTGCFAGGLVNRWGLARTYCALALIVGVAVATLPLVIGTRIGIYVSAACFGAGFIVMTALFGIWSMHIFRKAPSIGFGFTFFLISLGQGAGPVLGGFAIPVFGHTALFVAAGLLCCGLVVAPPRDDARKAAA